jgi:hypothetical protein
MCCRTSKFDIEPQNTNLRPANVTSIREKVPLNLILLVSLEISKIRKVLYRWIDLCRNELG